MNNGMVTDLLKYCDSIDNLCEKNKRNQHCYHYECYGCSVKVKQAIVKRVRKIINEYLIKD